MNPAELNLLGLSAIEIELTQGLGIKVDLRTGQTLIDALRALPHSDITIESSHSLMPVRDIEP